MLDYFCETFEPYGLFDLGLTGYEFTWENRRGEEEIIEEQLDWFCSNVEWSSMFPEAEVLHLDEWY